LCPGHPSGLDQRLDAVFLGVLQLAGPESGGFAATVRVAGCNLLELS
jgi:hypothetical protein